MRNIIPILLALQGGNNNNNNDPPATKTMTSYTDLTSQFNSLYDELNPDPATVQSFSVPSIQFSMVSPPDDDDNNNNDDNKNKPMALYLPGLDGRGISGSSQFNDMSQTFDLWRMTVDVNDRSTFSELANEVVTFLLQQQKQQKQDVTLIGESFGGLLAPMVAMKLQSRNKNIMSTAAAAAAAEVTIKGLVLINPATSFDDTNWDQLGPLLSYLKVFGNRPSTALPTPYSVVGGLLLSALIPDTNQLQRLLQTILNIPISTDITNPFTAMKQGFDILQTQLPPETIYHRVSEWMLVGSTLVSEKRLMTLNYNNNGGIPTLVIAGTDDAFLPSAREARRLQKVMDAETLLVEGAGHFVLDPTRFNLTEALIYCPKLDPLQLYAKEKEKKQKEPKKKYDIIKDWKLPSSEEIHQAITDNVQTARQLTSPIFFSTSPETGKRWKGLGQLPTSSEGGPIVFVANHQLFGLDLGLLIAQLLEERNITARGLAHPILWNNTFSIQDDDEEVIVLPNQPTKPGIIDDHNSEKKQQRQRTPGNQASLFEKFGAVPVTPRNYYRLLADGQNVLLFPGGVREVFHGPEEAHTLFWPDSGDFVRTAVKCNATIIPISAVGLADSFDIPLTNQQLVQLPFGIGDSLKERSENTKSARFNQDNSEELFVPPLFLPKLSEGPARQYFVFGKPFATDAIHHKDIEECTTLYQNVQRELNRGFQDVLEARNQDPYQNNRWARVGLERVTNKQVPTFGMDELNGME